ncbi:MAG: creatininase family protein [Gemmatimonadota bacterium]
MNRLADMTWEEVRELDPGRTVAVLPLGAVEAHGPHLPIGTDTIIARGMAERAADLIAGSGRGVLVLPPLAYTPAVFAAGFAGTLGLRPGTLEALLVDVAESLTRQGIRALAIANAHLDPTHLGAVHAARDEARARGFLDVVFPDLTKKPWALRLGEEFRTGACHAGRFEGSLVLALEPGLVRDEIRRELAPNPASLSDAIRAGVSTFEDAGGPRAYFGWPADATPAEGERTIGVLGEILAEAVGAALDAAAGNAGAAAQQSEPGA